MLTGTFLKDIAASVRRMAEKIRIINLLRLLILLLLLKYGGGVFLQIVGYKLTLNTASYSRSL